MGSRRASPDGARPLPESSGLAANIAAFSGIGTTAGHTPRRRLPGMVGQRSQSFGSGFGTSALSRIEALGQDVTLARYSDRTASQREIRGRARRVLGHAQRDDGGAVTGDPALDHLLAQRRARSSERPVVRRGPAPRHGPSGRDLRRTGNCPLGAWPSIPTRRASVIQPNSAHQGRKPSVTAPAPPSRPPASAAVTRPASVSDRPKASAPSSRTSPPRPSTAESQPSTAESRTSLRTAKPVRSVSAPDSTANRRSATGPDNGAASGNPASLDHNSNRRASLGVEAPPQGPTHRVQTSTNPASQTPESRHGPTDRRPTGRTSLTSESGSAAPARALRGAGDTSIPKGSVRRRSSDETTPDPVINLADHTVPSPARPAPDAGTVGAASAAHQVLSGPSLVTIDRPAVLRRRTNNGEVLSAEVGRGEPTASGEGRIVGLGPAPLVGLGNGLELTTLRPLLRRPLSGGNAGSVGAASPARSNLVTSVNRLGSAAASPAALASVRAMSIEGAESHRDAAGRRRDRRGTRNGHHPPAPTRRSLDGASASAARGQAGPRIRRRWR